MPWYVANLGTVFGDRALEAASPAAFERQYAFAPIAGPFPAKGAADGWIRSHGSAQPAPAPPTAQWWIVLTMASPMAGELVSHIVQSPSAPPKTRYQGVPVNGVYGPWATKAEAQAAWNDNSYLNKAAVPPSDSSPLVNTLVSGNPEGNKGGTAGFQVGVTGIAPWFMRGLKIVFGGVLIILGVSRLTGAENAITSAASQIKVIPL